MSNRHVESVVIMVVDDDLEVRKLIIEYLMTVGFKNFIEADNGTDAYSVLDDPFQRIDLIISDWEMPKTTGYILLKALRQHPHRSKLPFIMVTSQQSKERLKISRAAMSKVNHYIIKPFRAHTLIEKVWVALGYESLATNVG